MGLIIVILVVLILIAFVIFGRTRRSDRPPPSAGQHAPHEVGDGIDSFWAWWRDASPAIAEAIESGQATTLVDEVSARVRAVGPLMGWEFGPGRKSKHSLTLSSEGDPALRVEAERWLSRAPRPDDTWEFHSSRQPDEAGRLTLKVADTELSYEGFLVGWAVDDLRRRVHVTVHHPRYAAMSEDDCSRSAFLMLDHTLGEDDVERWIGRIGTSRTPPEGGARREGLVGAVEALRRSAEGEDQFAILEGSAPSGDPMVATINMSLKRVDHLFMDHHYEVHVPILVPTANGLSSPEEGNALNGLEDELLVALEHDAVYVGRETGCGERVIHLHAAGVGPVESRIREWAARHPERGIRVEARWDPRWEILERW